MRKFILLVVTYATLSFPARAQTGGNIHIVNGTCDSTSHTAEGPIDSDLTKRQSKFYCDSAVITFLDDYTGHVMIQFSQKASHHSPSLAFAGRIQKNQPGDVGTIVQLDHVYLEPGEATTVSDGACKIFMKAQKMSAIACGIKVDETGRRTTAIVAFNVSPDQ
jgi:hypothetical protein